MVFARRTYRQGRCKGKPVVSGLFDSPLFRRVAKVAEAIVPKEAFFTKGVGKHRNKLQSFELALRDAGIEICNLVRVSSIFPPHCKVISAKAGLAKLQPGQITHVVLADISTNEPSRLVGAGVGLAIPARGDQYGYISEHHAYGLTEPKLRDLVEDMAATMLATTLGINFDANKDYNERKEQYMMGGEIVDSTSITMATTAAPGGVWTTVISAAILI